MMGIVDGSKPSPPPFLPDHQGKEVFNLASALLVKKDQFLLNLINVTISKSILSPMYGLHTSQQVWNALANRFSSQS